jgi:hypothetical protein
MTVVFMRCLQRRHDPGPPVLSPLCLGGGVSALLRCEERTPSRAESVTATLSGEHDPMIFQTTGCACESVRMRSTVTR